MTRCPCCHQVQCVQLPKTDERWAGAYGPGAGNAALGEPRPNAPTESPDCKHCDVPMEGEGYCQECAAPLCPEHDGGSSESGPYCAYGFGCNARVCTGCGCGSPGITRHYLNCENAQDERPDA